MVLRFLIYFYGTYQINREKMVSTLLKSRILGYEGYDLAHAYGNEKWFGRAKKIEFINRKKLFITTKFNLSDKNIDLRKELEGSLERLGTNYVDLYLMHWPYPNNYINAWKQMENLYKEGKARAIGVCNFQIRHLEELLKHCDVIPMVNQSEIHPLNTEKEVIQYCKEKSIQVQAYCPLGLMQDKIVENGILNRLAVKYDRSIPQIILKWNIQNEIIPLPKSTKYKRLKQNIDIFDFELEKKEIQEIDSLNENYKIYIPEKYCKGY